MAKCRSCDKRNAGTGATVAEGDIKTARELGLCVPCMVDGEWENEHTDNGHTASAPVEGCWACHPELNPDFDGAPEPRRGSSRAGVVHSVPRKATGREKAKLVSLHVGGANVRSYAKGTISCRIVREIGTVRLDWDTEGHFLKSSKIDFGDRTRKVRNVSEAYRLLAISK